MTGATSIVDVIAIKRDRGVLTPLSAVRTP